MIQKALNHIWYQDKVWLWPLLPLSKLFSWIARLRRHWLQIKAPTREKQVPVIVVGNIAVGGTGKTPLIIYLASLLKQHGYTPGIITRGYKSRGTGVRAVQGQATVEVGDEAILIKRQTGCTVMVSKDRQAALEQLLRNPKINVVLSDDGLQHYALPRNIEIAVIDGMRQFGNQQCLPVGPLREPISRLSEIDFVVINGDTPVLDQRCEYLMQLEIVDCYHLCNRQEKKQLQDFVGKEVYAVAGIGNNQRFFTCLKSHQLQIEEHSFNDHHQYQMKDFMHLNEKPILMTEKDAVKCEGFALDNAWVISVEARLSQDFSTHLLDKLSKIKSSLYKREEVND